MNTGSMNHFTGHTMSPSSMALPVSTYIDILGASNATPLYIQLKLRTAGKTADFRIHTSDNVSLGAWFILADSYYQTLRTSPSQPLFQPDITTVEDAIRSKPTILYFHGSAGSRATTWRVQQYIAWTSRLDANIFVIDYRGFGNSEGSPFEEGLALDAYATWSWLMEHGAKPEDVLILGHSLGTGVSGKLGSRLAREGVKPRGIALLAPFSSMATLLDTYNLWGIPVLQPLQSSALGRSKHVLSDGVRC